MFTETPKGEIGVSIKEVLSEEIREEFGDKPVIDINMTVNGIKKEWSNDSVEVEIAIPYTPTEEELKDLEDPKNPKKNSNKIIAVYIADNGEIIPLTFRRTT